MNEAPEPEYVLRFIVVTGNPVDGFGFVGPFDTRPEAIEFGTGNLNEWWVATLTEWVQA